MRLFLAAASDWRSLIWLAAGIVASFVLNNPFPAIVGLGLFLFVAQRLAHSPAFLEADQKIKTAQALAERYKELHSIAREVTGRLSRSVPVDQGRSWFARASDVATAAREIYQEWQARPKEHAGQTEMVEEALKMAVLYFRLLNSYHALYSYKKATNLREVQDRLMRNQRRLAQITDLEARRDLQQAIDLDQKVLEQATRDDVERERFQAKLAAIESSMEMLRREIFTPNQPDDVSQRLHDMLLEAAAMDEALTEVQQQTRVRVH